MQELYAQVSGEGSFCDRGGKTESALDAATVIECE